MKIAAVVVVYNPEIEQLKRNIESYASYVNEVIAVDNSDYNIDYNSFNIEKIVWMKQHENYGIGKALNVGVNKAIEDGCDYVLTMDQDSKFSNNLIDEYLKYVNESIAILSPNYIIDRKKNKQYKEKTNTMYWTMTSGSLLSIKAYKKIGNFKEEFFIDAVDYEYCLRARANGYKIIQVNSAYLLHNPGITKEKKILFFNYKYGYMSPLRLYYQIRNLSCIAKEFKSYRSYLVIIMKLAKIFLLFDNKKEFLKMFKKARKDFKNNKYGKYEG